jgi:hypothetical protein
LAPPKKKQQKKKSPNSEPTKEFSENKFDTHGSIGSPATQAGRDAYVEQHININPPEKKPIKVPPQRYTSNLIWFGKKIMKLLFGSLVHSMVGYAFGTSGLFAGTLVLAYFALYRNPLTPYTQAYSLSQAGSFALVLVTLYLGPFLVRESQDTQCPFCGARFSYGMIDSLLLDDRKLASGRIIEHYQNTYGCEVCQRTKRIKETEDIPPPPPDSNGTD